MVWLNRCTRLEANQDNPGNRPPCGIQIEAHATAVGRSDTLRESAHIEDRVGAQWDLEVVSQCMMRGDKSLYGPMQVTRTLIPGSRKANIVLMVTMTHLCLPHHPQGMRGKDERRILDTMELEERHRRGQLNFILVQLERDLRVGILSSTKGRHQ